MDWKIIANEWWVWFSGGVTAVLGLAMAWYFLRTALRFMHSQGFTAEQTKSMIRGAAVTAVGPVLANVFVMIALAVAISPAFAWQREGVGVGSVFTELAQASNAAIAAGEKFGDPSFTIKGLAAAILIMNIAGWGWSVEAIFTRYLGEIREKVTGGDQTLLAVIASASMVAIFSYYSITNAIKSTPHLITVILAAFLAIFLFKLADWIKTPRLKEWSLGIAMFVAMIVGKLVAG